MWIKPTLPWDTNMKTAPNLARMAPSLAQRGFTLIEIAIVLVIIGLLLGGVLQGQQLIENSRVKSAVNDFNGIAAATFSYQDRYGRLPGDDPGAIGGDNGRGGSWALQSVPSTAGNGVLEAKAATAFEGGEEVANFFSNLRSAGFIAGDPSLTGAQALPQNPFGGLTTIVSDQIFTTLNGNKVCMGNVGGSAAIALDTQLDDGSPDSGRFRALDSGTTPNAPPSGTVASNYSEDASYTVCYRM
jgi:prepilin-type N-terminal cleavage/methylation domain-containing protein